MWALVCITKIYNSISFRCHFLFIENNTTENSTSQGKLWPNQRWLNTIFCSSPNEASGWSNRLLSLYPTHPGPLLLLWWRNPMVPYAFVQTSPQASMQPCSSITIPYQSQMTSLLLSMEALTSPNWTWRMPIFRFLSLRNAENYWRSTHTGGFSSMPACPSASRQLQPFFNKSWILFWPVSLVSPHTWMTFWLLVRLTMSSNHELLPCFNASKTLVFVSDQKMSVLFALSQIPWLYLWRFWTPSRSRKHSSHPTNACSYRCFIFAVIPGDDQLLFCFSPFSPWCTPSPQSPSGEGCRLELVQRLWIIFLPVEIYAQFQYALNALQSPFANNHRCRCLPTWSWCRRLTCLPWWFWEGCDARLKDPDVRWNTI